MFQTTRLGVAPLNLQPRWPEEYLTVLREAGHRRKTSPTVWPGSAGSLLSKKTTSEQRPCIPQKGPRYEGKNGGAAIPFTIFSLLVYPPNAKSAHVPHRSL